jgi:predicted transcriptional regulator
MTITDKDIMILEIIAGGEPVSQRRIVDRAGLSLGMVNLILQRLARTGYLKMVNLSKRKIRYLVTPKGIAEKTNRSYDYFQRTLKVYVQYRERIEDLIEEQRGRRVTDFVVAGKGDLADLVHEVLRSKKELVRFRIDTNDRPTVKPQEVVLHCGQPDGKPLHGISILETLLKPENAFRKGN